MNTIRAECPRCHVGGEVDAALAGRRFKCARCGASFDVAPPEREAPVTFEIAAEDDAFLTAPAPPDGDAQIFPPMPETKGTQAQSHAAQEAETLRTDLSASPSGGDTLVWITALIPLICFLLRGNTGTAIILFSNIGLLSLDELNLKKLGYDTGKLGGAFLVPVYLFKRASLIGGGNGYAWVWLATFGVSLFV